MARDAVVERFKVVDSAGYPLCMIDGLVEFAETLSFSDDWFIEYGSEEEAEEDAEKYGGNVESFTCIRRMAA